MLLGSDVKALFPSMSAEKSAIAVKNQVKKIKMEWLNIDDQWLRLYIHLNRDMCSNLEEVIHLLPHRREGRRGVEAGMGSRECGERQVRGNSKESNWTWPDVILSRDDQKNLIGTALEIAVKYFFSNFTYTFGGEVYLQSFGGPIGARVTMCIARIVMQEWSDEFEKLLKKNCIDEKMRGIYVDDGRMIIRKLKKGIRFDEKESCFNFKESWFDEDNSSDDSSEMRTEREMRKAMCSVSTDLVFTTETEFEFQNGRLPTLSFELLSELSGLRHSYFEKSMRTQIHK